MISAENDVEYAELYEQIPRSCANEVAQSTDEFDDFMSLPLSSANKQGHNNNYAEEQTLDGTDNPDDKNANFWSKVLFSTSQHRTIPNSMNIANIASGSRPTKALKFLSLQEHDETTQSTFEERYVFSKTSFN